MMRIIDAHPILSARTSQEFQIDARSVTGGTTFAGREQVIRSPKPIWRAKLSPLVTSSNVDAWEGFIASISGRGRAIRIGVQYRYGLAPLYMRFGASAPVENGRGRPFSSGKFFSSGMGFASPQITFSTSGAASEGSPSLTVAMGAYANGFRDGDKIGIEGNLYIITAVSYGSGIAALTFEPPLRKDIPAGGVVTMHPTVVMQLVDDRQGKAERVARNPLVSTSIELIELPELT